MTSIVICTKNRLEYLKALVESIRRYTQDYEMVVVDDVSTDGTGTWLDTQKDIRHISYTKSIPVAEAWNLGVKEAKGKFVCILNDDMEVTPNWLENLHQCYSLLSQTHKVGCLATHLLKDGQVLSRGGKLVGTYLVPVPPTNDIQEVDYSNTPFFTKSAWMEVGGDPRPDP